MSYQVTIYSEAEKAKIRAGREWSSDPSSWARYRTAQQKTGFFGNAYEQAAELWISIQRGEGNLTTQAEWVAALAAAIKGCSRDDGNGRGMSKAEFMGTLTYRPLKAEAERWAADGRMSYGEALKLCRKAWNCDWQITAATPRVPIKGGSRRNMKAAELRGVLNQLGWG